MQKAFAAETNQFLSKIYHHQNYLQQFYNYFKLLAWSHVAHVSPIHVDSTGKHGGEMFNVPRYEVHSKWSLNVHFDCSFSVDFKILFSKFEFKKKTVIKFVNSNHIAAIAATIK